jgi:DNA repair exonuclease SbcCD nuclease subunit
MMNNQYIVISDLHAHSFRDFDLNGSRLAKCMEVIIKTFRLAHTEGIENVLFCGDLTDQQNTVSIKVTLALMETFAQCFEKYPNVHWWAISGNHDLGQKSTIAVASKLVSTVRAMAAAFPNFHCMDMQCEQVGEISLAGIPYLDSPEDYNEALNKMLQTCDPESRNVLMIHQTPLVPNAKFAHDTDPADRRYYNFSKVFCGHIHQRRDLTLGFAVVGNPIQIYADDGGWEVDNGVLIWDCYSDTTTFVAFNFPKFIKLAEGDEDTEKYQGHYIVTVPKQALKPTTSVNFHASDGRASLLTKYFEAEGNGKPDTLAIGLKLLAFIDS